MKEQGIQQYVLITEHGYFQFGTAELEECYCKPVEANKDSTPTCGDGHFWISKCNTTDRQ
jgi:hypothetical protein